MQEHGLDRDAFLSPRFVRLAQIRRLRETGSLDGDLYWVRTSATT